MKTIAELKNQNYYSEDEVISRAEKLLNRWLLQTEIHHKCNVVEKTLTLYEWRELRNLLVGIALDAFRHGANAVREADSPSEEECAAANPPPEQ